MTPDLSWIAPLLAVGARFDPAMVPYLARDLGVRWVVDLRAEERDDESILRAHGIELLHLPTRDTYAISPESLERGAAWVGQALDRAEKVLVHCQNGIGRSALMAACVLVARGATPLAALRALKQARPRVCPGPEQLEALLEFATAVCARDGRPAPEETFREFASACRYGL